MLLSLWDRAQVILWIKRSSRYLPYIENMLQTQGLPDDLKFVAVAESALRPHAGSSKGAVGFWQFLPDTARRNGLAVNRRIDERRNIFASTRAALGYLKMLYRRFGSWALAAAAYNMGEDGLAAEILDQETKNYYRLYLPLETQRYLFRILSVKLIFSDSARYGFRVRPEDCYAPLQFDRVRVTCRDDIPIRIIARAAQTDFKTIKDLNPEIRGYGLAPGSYDILIPKGAGKGFEARYNRLVKAFFSNREEWIYTVKRGDNLSFIAEKFNVPLTSVLRWNKLDPARPIRPGDRLIIYGKRPHRR